MSSDPLSAAAGLQAVLSGLAGARVCVLGDFCLDAYWDIDAAADDVSIETGLPVHRVASQRYQLGGAGNVVANLRAMGVGEVRALGCVGDDMFGRELHALVTKLGVDAGSLRLVAGAVTPVYVKPMTGAAEGNRIDLCGERPPMGEEIAALVDDVALAAEWADVLLVNQQLLGSANPALIDAVNRITAAANPPVVIVDSRDAAHLFTRSMLKCNDIEAARLCQQLGLAGSTDHERAAALSRHTERPVFLTRGARGMLVHDGAQHWDVNGVEVAAGVDTVGAGDTVLAALGGALGGGAAPVTAAAFANLAASVVVGKLHTTGTATAAEIATAAAHVRYVYEPDLAEDPRRSRRSDSGATELVSETPAQPVIRHVVFDHDGTLSALREGWEDVMRRLMFDAVVGLGAPPEPGIAADVRGAIAELIASTTGAPTIQQMAGLEVLVRRFGFVPSASVLTGEQYKASYNTLLSRMVGDRIAQLDNGVLDAADYEIKGARRFLELLAARGVTLYLASGTDTGSVIADANALGYAHLFEGRITGASDDPAHDAKRVVMDEIVSALPEGETFAVFGDGPVELHESRRRGGVTIGVCSDERRRHGFNPDKRSRLIRAGAQVLIGDYSRPHEVLELLGLS